MVKKKKRSRGVDAMDDDAPAVVETAPVPNGVGGQEAMDTADDDAAEPTGAELDLLSSKKKRKKRGLKLNSLQIQGLGMKKEPQKRKAVNKRKEKSIERALLNMDKQQEKLQKDEVCTRNNWRRRFARTIHSFDRQHTDFFETSSNLLSVDTQFTSYGKFECVVWFIGEVLFLDRRGVSRAKLSFKNGMN